MVESSKQTTELLGDACPECSTATLMSDPELGELFCPNCGFTSADEEPHSTIDTTHGGSPSFPFLYDKGLSTSFNPSDMHDDRVHDFRRLAAVDKAAKGIRPKESSILNVCRNILPILENNCGMSRGMIDRVKTKITEIILKNEIPRVEGIYPALICHALLALGIRVDRKKVIMELTDSRPRLLREPAEHFNFISKEEGWVYEFIVDEGDPADQYLISARAESIVGNLRGNVTAWVSVVSCVTDETNSVSTLSRAVEERLRIHLQTDKQAYMKGETMKITAHVTMNDNPDPLTDKDIQLSAYVYSGGRFRKANKALWALCFKTGLRPPQLTAADYLRQCKLLTPNQKISALNTLSDIQHTAKLYGVHLTIRQQAAITTRIHLLNYDDASIANEFAIGVSALSFKKDFVQRVLGTNCDILLFSLGR